MFVNKKPTTAKISTQIKCWFTQCTWCTTYLTDSKSHKLKDSDRSLIAIDSSADEKSPDLRSSLALSSIQSHEDFHKAVSVRVLFAQFFSEGNSREWSRKHMIKETAPTGPFRCLGWPTLRSAVLWHVSLWLSKQLNSWLGTWKSDDTCTWSYADVAGLTAARSMMISIIKISEAYQMRCGEVPILNHKLQSTLATSRVRKSSFSLLWHQHLLYKLGVVNVETEYVETPPTLVFSVRWLSIEKRAGITFELTAMFII